jgi:hypothetical protein
MKRIVGFILLIAFSLFNACSPDAETRPVGILPPDSMIVLMYEIHLTEAAIQSAATDTVPSRKITARGKYTDLMQRHALDAGSLRKNFDYYRNRPEVFREIYAEVIARLESETARAVTAPAIP